MYFSIPQALSFSLFGIPLFGVDTCGFNGNSDAELCSRWMQLSAFFPFYRNHNTLSAIPQEAYVWESVAEATRTVMTIRFQLLPYLYTLFWRAHERGDTVMRALAWEFPLDPALAAADRQFFLGPAVLVTPVLDQGVDTVQGVFPGLVEGTEVYYDWYNHSRIATPAQKNTTIDAPLGHIPVFIRGGHVLAMQQHALTTRDARRTGWSVLVALGVEGTASGMVYLDDGESLVQESTKVVGLAASANAGNGSFELVVSVEGAYAGLDTPLGNVTVLGWDGAGASKKEAFTVQIDGMQTGSAVYDQTSGSLFVGGLEGAALRGSAWGGGGGGGWRMTVS